MKKKKRKEISDTLYQLMDAHLSARNANAADKVQKLIRSASKNIAKKFAKAMEHAATKGRAVKATKKTSQKIPAKITKK
jgi:hypothetical protein